MDTTTLQESFIRKTEARLDEVFAHIATANAEMGETRDEIKEITKKFDGVFNVLSSHKAQLTEVKTDLSWLKKFFWILATGVTATLVASVMNLILQ